MPDDSQPPVNEPDEELVLPQANSEAESARQRKPVEIPDKTKTSGMVRRQLSVGDLKRRVQPEPFQLPGGRGAEPAGAPPSSPRRTDEAGLAAKVPGGERPIVREGGGIGKTHPPSRPIDLEAERPEIQAGGRQADAPAVVSQAPPQPHRRRRGELEGEDAWTGSRSSLWFVLAGLICIGVVGYFLSAAFKGSKRGAPQIVEPKRAVVQESIAGIPIAEFVAKSAELLPIVSEILEKAQRNEGKELEGLVRGGAASVARMPAWRARDVTPARHFPLTERQLHAAALGGTGYLVLVGLDSDHLLASAYFVKEGGEFKFDWEASEGYSDYVPGEKEGPGANDPKLMRAVISVSDFYTEQFPESEYRCYAFHHQDPGEFVWGFAKRESVVDRSLMASYTHPDLVGTDRRVTIRVKKGPEGARANQLEVVEFLHSDWLAP